MNGLISGVTAFVLFAGEMKRIADEQKRIEELQTVMKTATQAKAASKNNSKQPDQHTRVANSNDKPETPDKYSTNTKPTIPADRGDDISVKSASKIDMKAIDDLPVSSASSYMTSSLTTGDDFAQPNISSISQSTEEPFILHKGSSQKADKKQKKPSSASNTSADKKEKASNAQLTHTITSVAPPSQPSATSSPKPSTPTSGGFLSSSQLSKRKVCRIT